MISYGERPCAGCHRDGKQLFGPGDVWSHTSRVTVEGMGDHRRVQGGRGLVRIGDSGVGSRREVIVVSPVAVAGYGALHQIHWRRTRRA